jgi:hypothetical protein
MARMEGQDAASLEPDRRRTHTGRASAGGKERATSVNIYSYLLLLPVVVVFLVLTIAAVIVPDVLGPVLALLAGWAALFASLRLFR